jgi:hypothetical protein
LSTENFSPLGRINELRANRDGFESAEFIIVLTRWLKYKNICCRNNFDVETEGRKKIDKKIFFRKGKSSIKEDESLDVELKYD